MMMRWGLLRIDLSLDPMFRFNHGVWFISHLMTVYLAFALCVFLMKNLQLIRPNPGLKHDLWHSLIFLVILNLCDSLIATKASHITIQGCSWFLRTAYLCTIHYYWVVEPKTLKHVFNFIVYQNSAQYILQRN